MSKELEALSLLVEKSIYGNKDNNRASIFEAEKLIKQALTPLSTEEIVKRLNEYLSSNGWLVDDKHGFVWNPEYWTFEHKQLALVIATDYCNMKDLPNDLRLEISKFFKNLRVEGK